MSFEKRNRKHLRTWSIVLQFVIWIAILFVVKFLNQYFLGNEEWFNETSKLFTGVDSNWFTGNIDWLSIFTGPIGFKSFISFKTLFGTQLALPVLIDFIVNWAFVLIVLMYLVLFSVSLNGENKINRILKEAKEPAPEKKPDIVEEHRPEVVAPMPTPLKVEQLIVEPEVVAPVRTPKPRPVRVAKPKPVVVKQPELFEPTQIKIAKPKPVKVLKPVETFKATTLIAEPKSIKKVTPKVVKVAPVIAEPKPIVKQEGYRIETVEVVKKHYEQTSKAEILEKLFLLYPDETKVAIRETVDLAFQTIAEALAKKEEVGIYAFGKFENQHKDSREGINPLTGDPIKIKASNSVKFKSAKNLKEQMSQQKWTGLYTVKKQIEIKEEPIPEPEVIIAPVETDVVISEPISNISKPKTKVVIQDTQPKDAEIAQRFLNNLETKYQKQLKNNKPKPETKGLTAQERARYDGSDSIIEPRSELQKHAGVIRRLAVDNKLRATLIDVNLRDMTKVELISYMQKVRASITK